MSPIDEVTIGEVSRKLDRLAGDVKGIAETLGDRPTWRDVNRVEAGLKASIAELDKRVVKLEDWQTWAIRIILGTIITGIIAAIFIIKP